MNRNLKTMLDAELVSAYESSFTAISDHTLHLFALAEEITKRYKSQDNPAIHTAARAGVRFFGALRRTIGSLPRMVQAARKDQRAAEQVASDEALRKRASILLEARREQRAAAAKAALDEVEEAADFGEGGIPDLEEAALRLQDAARVPVLSEEDED